jgi:hypothetical protein
MQAVRGQEFAVGSQQHKDKDIENPYWAKRPEAGGKWT